jgi:beta-N-acetylhexosaminidase
MASACLLASFRGHAPPGWLLRRVEGGLAGVCLFGGNVRDAEQVVALTSTLRAAREDVVIAVDEEGGDVTRLEAATGLATPGNAALGAVDDVALTERVARAIGGSLAALGVTLDLAPVVDVNSNPENPVIGVRSFGAEPNLVARHGAAAVRGLQTAGVAACAKHFPGHGDTAVDSHLALPTLRAGLDTLRARDLVPFAAAIDAGVAAVMTSHLVVAALDDRPATLSAPVLRGVLRDELGFSGAVVTDALDMAGVGGERALPRTAPAALAAGADLLCLGSGQDEDAVEAALGGIAAALASGELGEERLADAAARAARLGGRSGGSRDAGPGDPGRTAARRAIRVMGPEPAPVRGALVVELRPRPNVAAGEPPSGLGEALAERDPATAVVTLREGDALPPDLGRNGRPLVAVVRDAGRHPWQRAALDELLARRPGALVVELGWPEPPPRAGTLIVTHGASRASCAAAADLLVGRG